MEQYIKTIVDCTTGEVITEPMSAEEIAENDKASRIYQEKIQKENEEIAAAAAAKESALSKLAELGLSADEVAALSS